MKSSTKKMLGAAVLFSGVIVAGLYGVVLVNGPRMTVQPHLRAFQKVLPPLPAGTRQVEPPQRLPSEREAARLSNPVPPSAAALRQGATYYVYYCVFCHGARGDGNGPVGQSYQPVPADLRQLRIRRYTDGRLLRAMLTGVGHEPVLERVVPPEHRWPLVLYLRYLSFAPAAGPVP